MTIPHNLTSFVAQRSSSRQPAVAERSRRSCADLPVGPRQRNDRSYLLHFSCAIDTIMSEYVLRPGPLKVEDNRASNFC